MTNAQLYTVIALCIYAAVMTFIGCISYGKSKTLDGFLIGGRNIGPWATAFAYGTTYFSAVVFVGYAGQHGWNIGIGSIWIGVGNAVLGCLLNTTNCYKNRSIIHTSHNRSISLTSHSTCF